MRGDVNAQKMLFGVAFGDSDRIYRAAVDAQL
jgi:hypothetical protein